MIKIRLRDLREDNDLTQKEMANLLNVKQQTYSNYETGNREMSYEMMIFIKNYFNTSLDYLFGETNIKTPYPRTNKPQQV